jgi:general secretion pathway protein G
MRIVLRKVTLAFPARRLRISSSIYKCLRGYTLLELLIVTALVGIILGFTVNAYQESSRRAQIERAISDIKEIELAIENFYMEFGHKYPADLLAIGANNKLDPWGNPYQYLDISSLPDKAQNPRVRKDKNLYPINSDYDLYSKGNDGLSAPSLGAEESKDDVVRANNGGYVGLGSNY